MPTVFQGVNYNNIFAAQYKTIEYVRDGFAFGHATESGTIGLREGATITATPTVIQDHRERELIDDQMVKAEIPFLQTTFAEYRNAYLLSKGFLSARFTDVNNRVFNFVANTAAGTSPNGSQIMSLGFKASIDMKKRSNALTLMAQLTRQELEWIFSNMTAQPAVASGGSAFPMAAMAYTYSNFKPANFTDILVNSNSIGVFGDPKIEISTVAQRSDFRAREINRFLLVNSQFVMAQTAANDLLAASSNSAQDNTLIQFNLASGEVVKFNNGSVSLSPTYQLSEKDFYTTVSLKGRIPYNITESAPEYIDIGVTSPTVWAFNFV